MDLNKGIPESGSDSSAQSSLQSSPRPRTPRALTRLDVLINGKHYVATKWNHDGCTVEGFRETAEIGDRLVVKLSFSGIASESTITCEGEVKWKKSGFLGLAFRSLPLYEQGLVSHQLREALKLVGKTRDDFRSNSDPASVIELENVKTVRRAESLFSGVGEFVARLASVKTAFAAAAVLLAITGIAVYQSRTRVVASGTIVSDYEVVSSTEHGTLLKILVRQGQSVDAGQPLFMTRDEDSYREEANRLAQLKRDLEEAEMRYEIKASGSNPGTVNYNTLLKQRELQGSIYRLYEDLSKEGAISQELLLEKQKEVLKLDGELGMARSDGDLALVARKYYEALEEIFREPQPQSSPSQSSRTTNTIYKWYYAPSGGRLLYLPRLKGSTINQGDSLAVIQPSNSKPRVRVYLLNPAKNRVAIGDAATVVIPSVGKPVKGLVVGIDNRGGVVLNPNENRIDDPFADYLPTQERPAEVLIQLDSSISNRLQLASVGMKVSVTIHTGVREKEKVFRP